MGNRPMSDDIVTRLRHYEPVLGSASAEFELTSLLNNSADEIERLRTMLAHRLTLGYKCEGCAICDDLKTFHNQVLTDD